MKGFRKLGLAAAATAAAAGVLLAAEGALQVDPKLPAYEKVAGRLGQPLLDRQRHDEQPGDALGRGLPQVLPERQGPGRGQGLLHGPAGPDRGDGAARPDVAQDEEGRDRQVRGEVRLSADRNPHGARRHRGLRQQGQPVERADARAGRRDLLEDPQGRLQGRRHDLGPARPDGRVGQQADLASTAATPPPARTGSSRKSRSTRATTRTPSRSSPARPRSSRASPRTSSGSATRASATRPPTSRRSSSRRRRASRSTPRATRTCSPASTRWRGTSTSTSRSIRSSPATAKISPLTREFLKFAISKEGQEVVVKDGYFPIPAKVSAEELRKLSVARFPFFSRRPPGRRPLDSSPRRNRGVAASGQTRARSPRGAGSSRRRGAGSSAPTGSPAPSSSAEASRSSSRSC